MHAAIAALVHAASTVVTTVTPSPSPTAPPPELVTPGPWGFAVIAFIALAVVLLVWDMLRRIRRGRFRSEIREELDAEEAAAADAAAADAAAADASGVDDSDIHPEGDPLR